MDEQFQNYVDGIMREVVCRDEQKAEIAEEMHDHLQLLKAEYMEAGKTEQQAAQLAISAFGQKKQVGRQLQKELFPHLQLLKWISSGLCLFIAYFLLKQGLALQQMGTDVDGEGIGIHFFIFEVNDRVPEENIPHYALRFLTAGVAMMWLSLLVFNKKVLNYIAQI
ncbi:permease prefix domain 1-containing protein [Planococcus lenghuensis]|uniref:Uncharacterized protein n=1 Tax=Planococcus lenghuensis TaxID=2213202 RepID=A0A1Q2KWJ8_9BACL|nr:permease prefix domain 1-containing protein [Planococcus lenghuensis]AQQ52595.1 hypothetical protein B0X71_05455 [Planococcus lenghuensis]